MKNFIIIICCLYIISCKKCEEDVSSKQYRIREYQKIINDSLNLSLSYKYNNDNFLTDVYANNEKIVHISKINDTLIELNYFWNVNDNIINAVLRVNIKGNRIYKLYEYNNIRDEIISVIYEYIYEGNDLIRCYNNIIMYFISKYNQYNFKYENNNMTSIDISYYYVNPFFGIPEYRENTVKAEYTDIPFNKYIPYQNTLDKDMISFKNSKYGAPIEPLYVLGINGYYCNVPNKNLVKNFESIAALGTIYKSQDYNYQVENNLVVKMNASDEHNYFKLIWE